MAAAATPINPSLFVNHLYARKLKPTSRIFIKPCERSEGERGVLAAFVFRFFIIFALGVLAFVTFLVATTLIWLMWLDSWRCGMCLSYPVGIYTLALLGLLILGSIGIEFGEASPLLAEWGATSRKWFIANWTIPVAVVIAILAILLVLNWYYVMEWWCNLW
jgi:hypothetical protein